MDPIGIVGSGAVAQALGRALRERRAPVLALAGRNPDRAERAAAFIGPGVRAVTCAELVELASHLIVAVSDDAIPSVAGTVAQAGLRRGVVLHTCGARGPEALAPLEAVGAACGVLHPLQTIPSPELGTGRLYGVTFGTGGDTAAVAWARELVRRLDGRLIEIAPGGFAAYHAAATLAGNGVAALVDSALMLMARAGIDAGAALEALAPLCRASAANVLAVGPVEALTGPVSRGDSATVGEHVKALDGVHPDVAALYLAVSARLLDLARRRGLDEPAARRIERLIETAEQDLGTERGSRVVR